MPIYYCFWVPWLGAWVGDQEVRWGSGGQGWGGGDWRKRTLRTDSGQGSSGSKEGAEGGGG